MHHPERWIFDWFYKRHDMDKADNRFYRQTETERRAEELHEGCRMPMEQARELAASEASPDWYARGQDWGLADALTNGQSGDWVLDDIARAFAAGAQAGAAVDQHTIKRMQAALAENASRSADYLRKAIKAEAEVALLRAALNGGNVIERLQFALQRLADAADTLGVNHFGDDWLSDEVQELQAATRAARLVLGPNAKLTGPSENQGHTDERY